MPSVTAAQDTTVDDARVAADNAEGYAVYGNNTGNIKDLKDVAESDPVGNTITVNTTKTLGSVHGGYSALVLHYSVSGNTVNMEDGSISNISGGESTNSGNVMDNTVNVSGGTVGENVRGGMSAHGNVTGNDVNISGGTINGNVYGGAMSVGASSSSVSGNTIVISGGTINGNVFGGHAQIFGGDVTGNTVNISGGTINSTVIGGQSESDDATGNTVTISGGTITGMVIGGQSNNGGNANNNIVTISGGSIEGGMVTGGMATGSGNATGNIVNILVPINLQGINGSSVNTGTSSGNTVNIAAKNVNLTYNIYGTQNLNFYLPSDIAAGDTMLTVNEGKTELTDVTIGAAAQTGVNLSQGDTVTLLSNANGFTGTAATTTLTTAPTATSLTLDTSYKFAINQGDTAITATVTDKTESSTESSMERAKSLVETRAATTTFINAGADMLSSQGFMQAANAVALEAAEQTTSGAAGVPSVSTFTPFAAVGGSSMRAQSGSYVDTKGFGLNVGFAREINNAQGKLLFGPVVEYGGGSYDSYLEDAAGTHGEGGAHYYGLGIMARQVNHDGLYYEGSLRGGRVNSDYKSNMDTLGKVDYDSSSNYFAAHLGVGKAFSIGNGNTLDGYLKYFYSHQAGDTTTIHIENAADERGSFDAVDSHRLRIGARLTHKVNERNSFYGGLAYQYEFGGEARAHFSSGGNVPSPSVKGGSGMLELGWQVKPGGPVTLDLGMTGWAGKQRGGSIQLGANWTF